MTKRRDGKIGSGLRRLPGWSFSNPPWHPAAEPARQFLQGLRDRGYYDTAVDYLNTMKTSKLAPVDLKETLLYDLGSTLIEASRLQRDIVLREKQLDEARDALTRFVGQNPDHPLVNSANSQLGNLLVERARIKMEQSKQPKADKAAMLAAARQQYEDAYKVFARSQNDLKERLAKMKVIDPKDTKGDRSARSVAGRLLASSTPVRRGPRRDRRDDGQGLAGIHGHADRGRGAVRRGVRQVPHATGRTVRPHVPGTLQPETGQAQGSLDLLCGIAGSARQSGGVPDAEAENDAAGSPGLVGQQAAPASGGGQVAGAVDRECAAGRRHGSPSGWSCGWRLAEAQWGLAEAGKKSQGRTTRKSNVGRATPARTPCSCPGKPATCRPRPGNWSPSSAGRNWRRTVPRRSPRRSARRKTPAARPWRHLQTANMVLQTFPRRIAGETDAKVKADLQKQLEDAQQTVKTSVQDALTYFQKALQLADDKTSVDDLNIVRYFLCFLHFSANDYYEAGLLGEFVARRYPDSSGARQCAKIAMAAYLKLYVENTTDDKEFESPKVTGIANYIAQKWSDQPEAIDALNTLVPLMIKAGKLEEAEKYLNDIPPDSPKRGEAEIKTGQAMWSEYLHGMQEIRKWESGEEAKPEDVDLAAKKATLEQIKARAQKILEDGVARMKGTGKVDESAATASSVAGADLRRHGTSRQGRDGSGGRPTGTADPGQSEQSRRAARQGFAGETYKSALRAYISSLAGAADADATVKKATEVMAAMKEAIPPDQLIVIYVSLARDLEQQMKLATPEAKKALSKGFETFLKQIRSATTEFSVLNWVAETFCGIAAGFDTTVQGKPVLTAEAKKYYDRGAGYLPDHPGQGQVRRSEAEDPNPVAAGECVPPSVPIQQGPRHLPGRAEGQQHDVEHPGRGRQAAPGVGGVGQGRRQGGHCTCGPWPARKKTPRPGRTSFGAGAGCFRWRPSTRTSVTCSTRPATTWPCAVSTCPASRSRRPRAGAIEESQGRDHSRRSSCSAPGRNGTPGGRGTMR